MYGLGVETGTNTTGIKLTDIVFRTWAEILLHLAAWFTLFGCEIANIHISTLLAQFLWTEEISDRVRFLFSLYSMTALSESKK